jgi:hypothetical protein
MRRSYCGIFFISAGTLLFEITLTRIFSISQWYHFAFMVVSIALLGFAASGSLLYLIPRIRTTTQSPFWASLFFVVSCVMGYYFSRSIEMDPYRLSVDPSMIGSIAGYYLLLFLPFLCAGIVISVLLSRTPQKVGILYGFNLAGSAVGCTLIFCFSFFGEQIILLSSLLGVMGALCFARRLNQRIIILTVCILLLLLPGSVYTTHISPYKDLPRALTYPGAQVLDTQWNSISRVDVVKTPIRQAPGLSLYYGEALPITLGVTVDGDTLSPLTTPHPFMDYLPTAAAYLIPRKEVLIINPHPLDVATARYFGSGVTVAEGNPLYMAMVNIHSAVYDDVTVIHRDGRNFLAGFEGSFDLIQISLTESLFASSVGLYGFNESYLFTREAFETYYAHLNEGGILLVTRWLVVPPRELPKLVSLVIDTVEEPQDHLVVFRTYSTTTLLMKKTPFREEIPLLERFCDERGFDLVWTPVIQESQINRYNRFETPSFYTLILSQLSDNETVKEEYLYAIASPTDNNPFFFNFFQWTTATEIRESLEGRFQPFFEGGFMAVLILIQAAGLSIVLVVVPFLKSAVTPARFTLSYFSLIGLGFMFVEIAFMQQLILFLGHPTYSLVVVLGILLLASGVGSVYSHKISPWKGFTGLLCILGLLTFGLSLLIHAGMGGGMAMKSVMLFCMLALPAFFMGIPFPTGLRTLHPDQVPYAWCVNGCASVCGSVLSVIIAISWGFQLVLALGLICYGAAALIGRKSGQWSDVFS